MASCDDDFSLLGDDTTQTNPSHHHHHHLPHHHHLHHPHHHHQPFASARFSPKPIQIHAPPPPPPQPILNHSAVAAGGSPEKIASGVGEEEDDTDGYTDAAFCTQGDTKCPAAFPDVNPFSEEDPTPFEEDSDPNKARGSVRNEKRKDREELSDGGTACCYRKQKIPGGGAVSTTSTAAGGGEYRNEYRKDREEWSDTAIGCLLEAYMEKFTQLNRGNLRGRDWEEVAAIVSERCDKQSKSVEQCKNKVDNLKKRYKLERHRMSNGGVSASHWPWFKKMEEIVGNSLPVKAVSDEDKSIVASGNMLRQSKRYVYRCMFNSPWRFNFIHAVMWTFCDLWVALGFLMRNHLRYGNISYLTPLFTLGWCYMFFPLDISTSILLFCLKFIWCQFSQYNLSCISVQLIFMNHWQRCWNLLIKYMIFVW